MNAEEMAAIHADSFTVPRPWTAAEFDSLSQSPHVFLITEPEGFLMGRSIAGEAEILTLAVAPSARGKGIGASLVQRFCQTARADGALTAFLEVSAQNEGAMRLYHREGFTESGRRKGYFHSAENGRIDAILMSRRL